MLRKFRIKKVESTLVTEFHVQTKLFFFWITIKKFVKYDPDEAFEDAEMYVYEHMDLDDDYYGCE